ncbi:MAG TPA: hypothetical protein VFK34_04475 [Marmoricola sp.]|jgi:voltage-gated potassium channel|nr:hypothetical protein [Marmoricola sp.]
MLGPRTGYGGRVTASAALLPASRDYRERLAEELLDRLTPAMSALGILFVLVIFGEELAHEGSVAATVLTVVGWLLWAAFALEFAARMWIAPDTGRFLRKNWWQLAFLVLPFLRVFRLVRTVRVLRGGRVVSGAVRGTRSTASVLRGRLGWVLSLWLITVLTSSELLFTFSDYTSFASCVHDTCLAAITGEPLTSDDGFAQVMEVFLAAFSVVVFGSIAGVLGAFFLDTDRKARDDTMA